MLLNRYVTVGDGNLNNSEDSQKEMQKEIDSLRNRLSVLSRAGLRITGDLDMDTVLQGVLPVGKPWNPLRASS